MKTFIHYLFILISVLTIASCENDLPFNVKDNPPKLVMNALINADSLTNIVFLNLTGKERVTPYSERHTGSACQRSIDGTTASSAY